MKRRKRKGEKKCQNVVKRDGSGMKAKLLCCKCLFDQIKANLVDIKPENHQNVQKTNYGHVIRPSAPRNNQPPVMKGKRIRHNNSESARLKG